jgi:EAL domain-containing protein (putative c-di-GMP-specific phosphodiesterase class I)/ActR/RegA family two-component response regulator
MAARGELPWALVVDDDPDVCDLVAAVAEETGFGVRTAGTRDEFVAHYEALSPAVIVLDLMMPTADGIELMRFLASRRSTSRIVLVSGVDPRVLATAQRLGTTYGLRMIGVLHKPIDVEGLEAALRKGLPPARGISRETLKSAIEAGELVVHYQPKSDLRAMASWDVVGCEALVRWNHRESGLLGPDAFVPLAERTGLIKPVTDFVFEAALRQLGRWRGDGLDLAVAVNLAPLLLTDLELPDRTAELAKEYGIDPSRMTIEITESGAMADAALTMDILTRFRLKGFGLSIDDFGTGYSSLVQLYRMPFNEMKIDKSFVMEIGDREEAVKIIRAIAGLAHSLGMSLCAEGLETETAMRLLRSLDCELAQGFLISKPLPAEDFLTFARRRKEQATEETPGG